MDDTRGVLDKHLSGTRIFVLILVFVDDTRGGTIVDFFGEEVDGVLILVFVDDTRGENAEYLHSGALTVLILVFVDDTRGDNLNAFRSLSVEES